MNIFKLIVCLLIFSYLTSSACGCHQNKRYSVRKVIKHTSIIVSAIVLSKEPFSDSIYLPPKKGVANKPSRFSGLSYKLKVITQHQGRVVEDTMRVVTGFSGAECGVEFVLGHTYFLYTQQLFGKQHTENMYLAHMCTRTTEYNAKEEHYIKRYATPYKRKSCIRFW